MRRSFFWFLAFLFLQVKASDHKYFLRRLTRAVNNRYQNTSWHNTDPSWYNSKPNNTLTGNRPQNVYGSNGYPSGYNSQQSAGAWNNPGGQYNQGYPLNPNNLTAINNRPQNIYGPNEYPAGNGVNQAWNDQNQAWNNPGGQYQQGNNPREAGWQPQSNSGYNSPQPFNSSGPQLINPAPHWQNPGGSGSIYPNLPTSNPYGYNTKPAAWNGNGQQWNNPPNQYYPVPNDLTLQRYERANIPPTRWNATHWNNTHSNKYPGNWTNIYHGNRTYLRHNRRSIPDSFHSRWRRNSHDSKHRHHNISWYNNDPNWYNISQSAWNGSDPEWNKPGGRFYNWQLKHATYDGPRHEDYHTYHHTYHYIPPPPPNYGPPPPNGPPPQHWPRHHDPPRFNPPPPNFQPPRGYPYFNNTLPQGNSTAVGNDTATNGTSPWVPEDDANGTKPLVPDNGPNFNGSNVNDTDRWGSELPDLEGGYDTTPAPL